MSTHRPFKSSRLSLVIAVVSVLGSRGAAQSIDDYAHGISDASLAGSGVPGGPFSDCRDSLMNVSLPCHDSRELVDAGSPQISLRAPTSAGKVSADALRHPISKKGLRALQKAQDLIQAGDHVRGLEQLREAAKISSAAPAAHSLLGQEQLRLGKTEEAIPELQQAVRLLPSNVAVRANLGLALLMTGETQGAEQELRRALHLDPNNPQTQLVLGMAVLSNGSHDEEAIEYLRAAERRLSAAHVVLAAAYARAGRLDDAEQEARAFLGPEGSYDPVVVRNWVELMARQAGTRAGFAYALSK